MEELSSRVKFWPYGQGVCVRRIAGRESKDRGLETGPEVRFRMCQRGGGQADNLVLAGGLSGGWASRTLRFGLEKGR